MIFPGEGDFGIVPLEAWEYDKPVIALGNGGVLETVVGLYHNETDRLNVTGIFFVSIARCSC